MSSVKPSPDGWEYNWIHKRMTAQKARLRAAAAAHTIKKAVPFLGELLFLWCTRSRGPRGAAPSALSIQYGIPFPLFAIEFDSGMEDIFPEIFIQFSKCGICGDEAECVFFIEAAIHG